MLKHRVITSLILAGLFFGSISFLPALILNIFFILIIAGAGREWAKLAGCSNPIIIFAYVSLILVMVWCIQQVIVFGDINSAELVQPLLGGSCFFLGSSISVGQGVSAKCRDLE